jgi:acetate kinase
VQITKERLQILGGKSMKVLVINCGSSSLKYQLFDMRGETVLAKGLVERIGQEQGNITNFMANGDKIINEVSVKDHEQGIKLMFDQLMAKKYGVIREFKEISGIGHRIVHGGVSYDKSVLINKKVKQIIRNLFLLAPLHNPPNLVGIECCEKLAPQVPQVAVFDTAFHQTIPPYAYHYGIAYEDFEQYGIRKYGFHGSSHRYVCIRAAKMLKKNIAELKIISCHLGNGASISAICGGKSVDTSMGLTPLEGLIMGTRSGDLDPAVIPFLIERKKLTVEEVNDYLNRKCGVLGISGVSSDFRDIKAAAREGNERATLALDMFCYRVKKYIGAYTAVLNGVDMLIFTGGLGENSPETRGDICRELDYLGCKLDVDKNSVMGQEAIISSDGSRVKILVIPTNEELLIAKDAKQIILNSI